MTARRILLTGASGQLGAYLLRELTAAGDAVVAWSGSQGGERFGVRLWPVDLTDRDGTATAFAAARPEIVLHAAAVASVAACQRDPAAARRVNVEGTANLAHVAAEAGARFVFVSTDLAFDGEHAPYREDDPVGPLSNYARTKVEAEAAARLVPGAAVVRLSLLFGPSLMGKPTFFDEQAAALRAGRPMTLFRDEWRTPLDLLTAARALRGIAHADVAGTLHLGGPERMSRLEMGRRLAQFLSADPGVIVSAGRDDLPGPEPRPRDTSLDASRWRALFPGQVWPPFEEALRFDLPCTWVQRSLP